MPYTRAAKDHRGVEGELYVFVQPVGYRKNGRPIFPIRGGSGPTGEPTPVAVAPAGLTQEAVNAIVKRESDAAKAAGITAAQAEMEAAFGMPVAEVKAFIEAKKASDDAAKTESQRAVDAANKAATDAQALAATAAQEVFGSRAEIALIRAGLALPDGAKDDVIAGILTRVRGMLTVQVSATPEQISADVAALKAAFPALFTPATGKIVAPGTDPKTPAKKRANQRPLRQE